LVGGVVRVVAGIGFDLDRVVRIWRVVGRVRCDTIEYREIAGVLSDGDPFGRYVPARVDDNVVLASCGITVDPMSDRAADAGVAEACIGTLGDRANGLIGHAGFDEDVDHDTLVHAGVGVTRRAARRSKRCSGGVGVHCRSRAFAGTSAARLCSRRGGLRSHDSSCSRRSELPFGGCLRKHYPNVGRSVNWP
jgi:hypothetical protein